MGIINSGAMRGVCVLVLVLIVDVSTALDCYVCNKTVKTVDRFTKEVTESLKCSQDPADWDIETCTDSRQFCWKSKQQVSYYDTQYDRGCVIPKNPFPQSSVTDSLDTGGNSICWYRLRKGGFYDGDDSCFCNTNLCNSGRDNSVSIGLVFLSIIAILA